MVNLSSRGDQLADAVKYNRRSPAESVSTIEARVSAKRQEAVDIVGFDFVSAFGQSLPSFSAGSHIDVHTPAGYVRQYSLCNDPGNGDRYQIAVLREPSSRGGSKAMHDSVQEGDLIRIGKPRNLFPLVGVHECPLLLAGGIGVTPILCMAERLAKVHADFEMHYCARSRERTAFYDHIRQSPFSSHVTFHFDDGPPEQRLDLASTLGSPSIDRRLYVCGPGGFLEAVRGSARQEGWKEDHIHFEYFSANRPDIGAIDKFEVQIASTGTIYSVPPDKSIVEVLATNGLEIPMSCEQGICGTCITRVLSGIPDHRDSILTEKEKAANDQLTPCCSRSLSSRLVLDI